MIDLFENVIADFKASESPESVLVVGDDKDRIKLVLAWPNVPINRSEVLPKFDERWGMIDKWQWLWQCVRYRKWDLENAVGTLHNLDKLLTVLISNRIIYPNGTVHSYVTRYLRDRVIKLFDAKPPRPR